MWPASQHIVSRVGIVVMAALVSTACTSTRSPTPVATSQPVNPSPSQPISSSTEQSVSPSSAAPSTPNAAALDPLTGLPPATSAAATRPALAVKVDNVAGAWPQAGLNQADIVFDLPVEGGLTRLLAVFHSQDVALVGPIRSARPVDADVLHLFGHAYFAFSGGIASDFAPLQDHADATLMWWDVTPSLFVTRTDHPVPHQVFANSSTLYAGGQARHPSTTPPPAIFRYSSAPAAGAVGTASITAAYGAATATWTWDGTKYLRTQDGHADLLMDGSRVSASDVVVMSVSVRPTAAHDSHGSVIPLPVVLGSGTAWVFRGGVMVQGIWYRQSEDAPMHLLTSSGEVIALAPGRTWVEVLPNSAQPIVH